MKYIITENRMLNVVENLIHSYFPEFNKNCTKPIIRDANPHIIYYKKHDDGRMEIFARYFFNKKELVLNHDLFMTLENMFGDHMTYVIDWFNKEFNRDAESVTF
jgi:hypothetical protein